MNSNKAAEQLEALSGRDVKTLNDAELDVLEYVITVGSRVSDAFVALVNMTPANEVNAARDSDWDVMTRLLASYPTIVATSFAQFQELTKNLGYVLMRDEYGSMQSQQFNDPPSTGSLYLTSASEMLRSLPGKHHGNPRSARAELAMNRTAGFASLAGKRRGSRWSHSVSIVNS